ncbi:MAG: hypothetical protein ACR2MP_10555, partial [Streptosporangiaceae bacterium]
MAQHLVIPQRLGRAHATNGTPHVAITVYVAIMFLVPTVLEMNTNPLTTFGDAGTLAAFSSSPPPDHVRGGGGGGTGGGGGGVEGGGGGWWCEGGGAP